MEALQSALDVVRTAAPQELEKTLFALTSLVPHLSDEILQRIDRTLEVAFDPIEKRFFVACDYNRDGNSFRSPWSNHYFPAIDESQFGPGSTPPEHLRVLEIECNRMLDMYRHTYYQGGVSSAYIWETHDDTVAGAFVIHKESEKRAGFEDAVWDSIHIAEVRSQKGAVYYRVTATIILTLVVKNEHVGSVDLGITLTRQHEQHRKLSDAELPRHVSSIGSMIEDLENAMRKSLERVYVGKTNQVLRSLRYLERQPVDEETTTSLLLSRQFTMDIAAEVEKRRPSATRERRKSRTQPAGLQSITTRHHSVSSEVAD